MVKSPDCNTGGASAVFVVEERANPSTDYFVLPAVSLGGQRVVRCGFHELPPAADLTGAIVVFVRYVSPAWAGLVEKERSRLRTVALFMDDDVLDFNASVGMPWRYRFKLVRLATWRRQWLRKQAAELWVSTPYLQRKYSDWGPRLILPFPLATPPELRRVFYHGSASHNAEIRWLRPVMEEVLRRDAGIAFEIIGGRDVERLYRGMPRVNVVHAMRWRSYQAFLAAPGRHIGLVPLMDLPFNRARSFTKFYDITRCGAVGIYSADTACSDVVSHGKDGLVVQLEQEAWVEAILNLAHHEPLRLTLLRNAEAKLAAMAEKAQRSCSGLLEGPGDKDGSVHVQD